MCGLFTFFEYIHVECGLRAGDRTPIRQKLLQYALRIQTVEQHDTGNMNLDKVIPLPLKCTDYVKTALKLVVDNNDISQKQLLKQVQNVCIVYACLAVKRNAGIVSTDAKYAAAAKGYEEIAVPGFFRWARENDIVLRSWLTIPKMAQTTMVGGERET